MFGGNDTPSRQPNSGRFAGRRAAGTTVFGGERKRQFAAMARLTGRDTISATPAEIRPCGGPTGRPMFGGTGTDYLDAANGN